MNSRLALLLLGRLSLVGCSILSVNIYTHLLGAAEVGLMNLILSVVGFFGLLIGSASLFFYRQVLEWQQGGKLSLNLALYTRFLFAIAIFSCVLTAAIHCLGDEMWRSVALHWWIAILFGNILIASLNGAVLYCLNALGYRGAYTLLSNLASWGGIGIAVVALKTLPPEAEYWLASLLAGQAISLALGLNLLVRASRNVVADAHPSQDFQFRAVIDFSWPLLVCTGLYWVQRSSYVPAMASVTDSQTLGLFSVAFSIGILAMAAFDTFFKELYSPIYYRAIVGAPEAAKVSAWNAYSTAFFPALLATLVLVISFDRLLLRILVSEEFRGYDEVLRWGAASQFLISIYSMFVLLASTFMNNRLLLVPNIIGAGISVLLLYILIDGNSFRGPALAVFIGLLATTMFMGARLRAFYDLVLPIRRIGFGLAASAPLLGFHFVPTTFLESLSTSESILVCLFGALYLALVQYLLCRDWLKELKPP